MSARPIYLGVGDCECGQVDAKLYHVPGTELATRSVCCRCLETRGYQVPTLRTADDIDVVDGKPAWRPESTTRPYPKEPEPHVGQLDLGHGHMFEAMLGSDDKLIGWLHTHPDYRNPSALCQSLCAVREINGTPVHQVICADPLTLTPSLLCRTCGAHGNVTNGKWEPVHG
jgi:hypothetical protein